MACKRNNMILKLWPKKQAKKNLHNSGLVIGAPLRPLESLDYQKEKKKKKKEGQREGWCLGLKLQCKVKKINEILKRRDYILPKIIMQKS